MPRVLQIQIPDEVWDDLVERAKDNLGQELGDLGYGLSDMDLIELLTKRFLSRQGAKVAGQRASEAYKVHGRRDAVRQAQEKVKDAWRST